MRGKVVVQFLDVYTSVRLVLEREGFSSDVYTSVRLVLEREGFS